jgi:hypothetical protein
MLATVIDTKALLETVVASFVAGTGITFAFALAILGAARFIDLRTEERPLLAGAWAAVGLVSFVIVLGAIVFGLIVMMSD